MRASRSSTRQTANAASLCSDSPSNQFGEQEPGSNEEIQEFCRTVYGVRFPMFAKLDVKGDGQHPLYRELRRRLSRRGNSARR